MRHKYCFIVAPREEVESLYDGRIVIIGTKPSNKSKEDVMKNREPSGYVVLCRAMMQKKLTTDNSKWCADDFKNLKTTKNSIVGNKSTPHFGANGYYYSYGLNGVYKIDKTTQSSIGEYGIRKSKDEERNKIIKEKAKQMEYKLLKSLQDVVREQSRDFLYSCNFLSPTAHIANHLQSKLGHININYNKFTSIGLYAAQVCVNATTQQFHTELDQGPTLIYVPNQDDASTNKYNFNF